MLIRLAQIPLLNHVKSGVVDHLTVNYQVGSPFAQDASDQANYVNNLNLMLTNDTFSNTYNDSWRNHPTFFCRYNAPSMPQMNFRPPLRFQGLPYLQQAPQKYNLETMMKSMLLAQQKQDEYIKQLRSKIDVFTIHNKMLDAQIAQQATS